MAVCCFTDPKSTCMMSSYDISHPSPRAHEFAARGLGGHIIINTRHHHQFQSCKALREVSELDSTFMMRKCSIMAKSDPHTPWRHRFWTFFFVLSRHHGRIKLGNFPTVSAQCFTALKLMMMGSRYHICTILVLAGSPRMPVPVFSGRSGAARRDLHQSE